MLKYFYAHTLEHQSPDNWEQMHAHEEFVAALCSQFLKRTATDMEAWGDLLGRWHDLGKYSDEFQKYLADANNIERVDLHGVDVSGKVDHSSAAVQLSKTKISVGNRLPDHPFAGHDAISYLKQRPAKPTPNQKSNASEALHGKLKRVPVDYHPCLNVRESPDRIGGPVQFLCTF